MFENVFNDVKLNWDIANSSGLNVRLAWKKEKIDKINKLAYSWILELFNAMKYPSNRNLVWIADDIEVIENFKFVGRGRYPRRSKGQGNFSWKFCTIKKLCLWFIGFFISRPKPQIINAGCFIFPTQCKIFLNYSCIWITINSPRFSAHLTSISIF